MDKLRPLKSLRGKNARKDAKAMIQHDLSGGSMGQVCVTSHTVDKLLELVPNDARIESMFWRYHKYPKRMKIEVPKKMQKFGVLHAVNNPAIVSVEGALKDTTKSRAKVLIKAICDFYGFKTSDLFVRRMTLVRDGARAFFEYSTKEIRETEDRRIKTKVLGLVAISRDPALQKKAYQLVSELNPKKYQCKFVIVEKKAVVCSSLS